MMAVALHATHAWFCPTATTGSSVVIPTRSQSMRYFDFIAPFIVTRSNTPDAFS